MINKYICMGYVAADPQFNEYSSGKCKATFSLGINYGKETTWVDIECWDKIAENCNSFVKKGSLVFIEGKLKYSSWKNKNGESKSKLYCVCDFLKMLNFKNPDQEEEMPVHKVKQINPEIEKDLEEQKEFEDAPW